MENQTPSAWTASLYMHALNAMRSLSPPMPDTVPESLRTSAWNWKTVQTQMAAWAELRHDFVLYAKQYYTPPVLCYYPAGYVEPRPKFYEAMKQLVLYARTSLTELPMTGVYPGRLSASGLYMGARDRAVRKTEWLNHLDGMAATLTTLQGISEREVDRLPFTPGQLDFIRSLVQMTSTTYGSEIRTYSGWYPRLYLESVFKGTKDPHPSEKWDPLVVDIHTDGADQVAGDPGGVLYNGTGNVAFMLVCIDVNGQRCLHGAPVYTSYEFTRPLAEPRLDDAQWKTLVRAKQQPAPPGWTESFLVPGPIDIPAGIE